ncbi:helix-turn-helix transcriptional regulator [Nitrosomonas sp.]|uniref:helix-turn-helix transcriptional regulator n=1 Tax=Nitrosomonas sp. TaxID=42353 RepID=UPI001E080C32|nr:LuxR C-terminal-related transcriptional regulator [Nitrosomonas sp.]MBX3616874.1 hypothetical protein [Nitrosomonas sp.]
MSMNKETVQNVLTGKDYQITSAIISWLNNCQTRNEFNQVLQTALLPLIACNCAFYGRRMGTYGSMQLLGSINQSTCCQHGWKQFLDTILQRAPSATLKNSTTASSLMVFEGSSIPCSNDVNFSQRSFDPSWQRLHHSCSLLSFFGDHQQLSCQFYFCRLDSQVTIFNQRDTELMELLRPVLLRTLRFIIYREESTHPATLKFWSDNTESITVIRNDGAILFQSETFARIIEREKHTFLSTALALIQSTQSIQTGWHSFLSKLGKRLYEIKLTLIRSNTANQQDIYFLQVSRVANKIGKIFNRLDRTGLTNRELEIATLIYQGNSPKEIAEEICLSYHTVRNHIKNIYSKLGVSTRSEMLVKLA